MSLPPNLKPFGRKIADRLFRVHAGFVRGLNVGENGELEASLKAPRRSRAGHLVVLTNKGDIWVRLAVPHTFYSVDDATELIEILGGFLSDDIFFAIVTFRKRWLETTLVRRNGDLRLDSKSGTVQLISWSGKHDKKFRWRKSRLNQTAAQQIKDSCRASIVNKLRILAARDVKSKRKRVPARLAAER